MVEPTASRTLVEMARAFTRGELSPTEADAFEDRLSLDQSARDALVLAVQERGDPRPDPAYRAEVVRRLRTWRIWLGEVVADWRRVAVRGLATAALVLVCLGLRPTPVVEPTAMPVPGIEIVPSQGAIARYWSDLPRGEHLARAVEEEAARKARDEVVRPGRPDATVRLQPDGPMMP